MLLAPDLVGSSRRRSILALVKARSDSAASAVRSLASRSPAATIRSALPRAACRVAPICSLAAIPTARILQAARA